MLYYLHKFNSVKVIPLCSFVMNCNAVEYVLEAMLDSYQNCLEPSTDGRPLSSGYPGISNLKKYIYVVLSFEKNFKVLAQNRGGQTFKLTKLTIFIYFLFRISRISKSKCFPRCRFYLKHRWHIFLSSNELVHRSKYGHIIQKINLAT